MLTRRGEGLEWKTGVAVDFDRMFGGGSRHESCTRARVSGGRRGDDGVRGLESLHGQRLFEFVEWLEQTDGAENALACTRQRSRCASNPTPGSCTTQTPISGCSLRGRRALSIHGARSQDLQ
jgi:hypothetical protein